MKRKSNFKTLVLTVLLGILFIPGICAQGIEIAGSAGVSPGVSAFSAITQFGFTVGLVFREGK
jgi:hypothetical protein